MVFNDQIQQNIYGNDDKHIDSPIPAGHVYGRPEQRVNRVTAWPAVFAKEPVLPTIQCE
jgi:hypothetical protein